MTENWNEPPELINFLIEHMPHVYAVPGNHDLPNHQIEDLHRSAFWTLVQAGKITQLPNDRWNLFAERHLAVYGYPYGSPVTKQPEDSAHPGAVRLAVVHANVWSSQVSAYPGVSQQEHIDHYHFLMKDNFDAVLFGDNHVSQWGIKSTDFHWCNPGPIFRRTTKEKNQTPAVAELFSDGHFEFREIPGNGDRWRDEPNTPEATEIDVRRLTELLTRLGDSGVDYLRALQVAAKAHDVRKSVRQLVGAIVEELGQLARKTGERL